MKDFLRVLNFAKPYWIYAVFNIVFNVLTVIFSLVSITIRDCRLGCTCIVVCATAKPPCLLESRRLGWIEPLSILLEQHSH